MVLSCAKVSVGLYLYTRVVQTAVLQFQCCDNVRKSTPIRAILTIFTGRTRNLRRIKVRLRLQHHVYFVTALRSKTHATANIDATCLIY